MRQNYHAHIILLSQYVIHFLDKIKVLPGNFCHLLIYTTCGTNKYI